MFTQSLYANVSSSSLQKCQELGAAEASLGRISELGSARTAEYYPGTNVNEPSVAQRHGRAWNARMLLSERSQSEEAAHV